MANPSDIFLNQYKVAAGEGAAIELKERMLAEKVPGLAQYTHLEKLKDIEIQIIEFFLAHLSLKERETLTLCRGLRNKLLHCDFLTTRTKLGQLGAQTARGGVILIKFDNQAGDALLRKIDHTLSGVIRPNYVADTVSTAEGSVFGWLLELGAAGDFIKASEIFMGAGTIIDRLANVADEIAKRKSDDSGIEKPA